MSDSPILKIAINVPLSREFDYLEPQSGPVAAIGTRVMAPFGRRQQVGVVVGHSATSDVPQSKIRRVTSVLDNSPLLSTSDLWLIRFTSDYYHYPVGEVVAAALPSLLRQGGPLHAEVRSIAVTESGRSVDIATRARRAPRQAQLLQVLQDAGCDGVEEQHLTEVLPTWRRTAGALLDKGHVERIRTRADDFDDVVTGDTLLAPDLNDDQDAALSTLRASDSFGAYLLDGVTGSGKTEVYLHRMRDVIDKGRQVLVLVPEIGLTSQLVQRLTNRLGIIPALLHSGLTDTQRLTAWRAARSGAARVVVGTRSAIFTPFQGLGLIVVDEEHDHSFKQQEGLRYSARDLAIARAKHLDIPVVLGSATPTLEMLQHCRDGSYAHILLPARAGGAKPPVMRLIDTVRTPATDGLSEPLAEAITQHLDTDGQVLIFLNRRGFAPTLICSVCGYVSGCLRCDSRLTVHAAKQQLRCHHCGASRSLDEKCRECGGPVKPLGEGTERLEEALRDRFPRQVVSRIDSDSTQRKGAMDDALKGAAQGDAGILVGTQMLSKGHHFPKLTLVGVVNADQGLFGTDFRSSEHMAQSIVQVAGRAGRESRVGEVLIQTAFPDNPFWSRIIEDGYNGVSGDALAERALTRWPPFTRLALVRAAAPRKPDAHRFLNRAKTIVESRLTDSLRILGPVDAPMARKAGRYRAQMLLQSSDRKSLHIVLRELRPALEQDPISRKVRWSIDVDPIVLF